MNLQLLDEQHFEFLSLKRGCKGWSESTLVKIPYCWKSHVTAHLRCEEILQCCKSDPLCIHVQLQCTLTAAMPNDNAWICKFVGAYIAHNNAMQNINECWDKCFKRINFTIFFEPPSFIGHIEIHSDAHKTDSIYSKGQYLYLECSILDDCRSKLSATCRLQDLSRSMALHCS